MYLVLNRELNILPKDIIDYTNEFILDREHYRVYYNRVLRELLFKRVLDELKQWIKNSLRNR